jgi:hypothetical protein
MGKADDLLRGAIDMHFHGYPEFSFDVPRRYTDEESAGLMVKAGGRDVVENMPFEFESGSDLAKYWILQSGRGRPCRACLERKALSLRLGGNVC